MVLHSPYTPWHAHNRGTEWDDCAGILARTHATLTPVVRRAEALVLVSLANPKQPQVVALGKIPGEESRSPEGVAHFERNGEHYVLSANEMNGTEACFKVVKDFDQKVAEAVTNMAAIPGITREHADILVHRAGITRVEDLLQADVSDLEGIPELAAHAEAIMEAVRAEAARRTLKVGDPHVPSQTS